MPTFLRKINQQLICDFKTKNSDFKNITIKFYIIGVLIFLSVFWYYFSYIALIFLVFFILLQFDFKSVYFLVFLQPIMSVFKKTYSSIYLTFFIVALIVLICGIRLFIDVIKKKKKVNWVFSIFTLLFVIFILIPFDFPNISTIGSLLAGTALVFLFYYYKNEIDFKEIVFSFIFGMVFSIFIGLFRENSIRLQELTIECFSNGLIRFTGAYTDPNIFCGELMICLALVFTLDLKKQIHYLIYPIFAFFTVVALFTLSKSGIILYLISFTLYVIIKLINGMKLDKLLKILSIFSMLIIIIIFMNVRGNVLIQRFFSSYDPINTSTTIDNDNDINTDDSIQINTNTDTENALSQITTGRTDIWKEYIKNIINDNKTLFFGHGVGTPFIEEEGLLASAPHNTYIQCLYYMGITGMLLILGMFFSAINYKKIKIKNLIGIIPIVIVFIYLFGIDFFSYRLGIYIILSFSAFTIDESKTKKKILHLLSSNKYSGAENVVCQIIKAFNNEEVQMIYCSPKGTIKDTLIDKNINYLPLKSFNIISVKMAILNYKPDIIHAHDMKAITMAMISSNVPVVAHIHQNHTNFRKRGIRSLLFKILSKSNKMKHIFWVSKSCYDDYLYKSFVVKKSSILSNIIDIDEIADKSNKAELQDKNDIIYLGRLCYPKDPIRLIEIAKLLKDSEFKFKFAIVGSGEYEKNCKVLTQEYNLNENIKFYGFQQNPYGLLKNAKLMLMTSISEGTPMCALESLALGTPIVSTEIDGMKDLIIDNKNGMFFETNDEAVEHIKKILYDKNKHLFMSNNAISISLKYNDIKKYKKIINKIYLKDFGITK